VPFDVYGSKDANGNPIPNGYYNDKPFVVPYSSSHAKRGIAERGFSVNLYGAESFMDNILANEFVDIMLYMEYNGERIAEGDNKTQYEKGGY
jgi:hypothetical protein